MKKAETVWTFSILHKMLEKLEYLTFWHREFDLGKLLR